VPLLASAIRDGIRRPRYDNTTTKLIERETPAEIADWIRFAFEQRATRAPEIQILCPMKKGPAGTDALNRLLQEILTPADPAKPSLRRNGFELRVGDRILVTGNDYDNDLFNGDIFYLRAIESDGSLKIDLDGTMRTVPADAGTGLSLAYAMTVHRAQGSEFPVVIVPMHTTFYMMLERRLLYTAVARARQTAVIVGQPKAISMAIGKHDPLSRQTLLRHYLTGVEAAAPIIDLGSDELF
jgi:exodeoxyribonuclease V alpha subunit